MQLIRLVLPAPFGPMMAFRAPSSTAKLTSCRAFTPPKRRLNPEMSRRGGIRRKTTLLQGGEIRTTPPCASGSCWGRELAKCASPDPDPGPQDAHADAHPPPIPRSAKARDPRDFSRSVSKCYFGGSEGAGAGVAPGCSPPGCAGAVSALMLSVIMPMVHPLEESRMASSALTARTYFVLSSASKKMTGGPWVASLLFATL